MGKAVYAESEILLATKGLLSASVSENGYWTIQLAGASTILASDHEDTLEKAVTAANHRAKTIAQEMLDLAGLGEEE